MCITLGFSDINPRGEDLLAYCASADLNFCNVGNNRTFRTKTREEYLELTLVNRCATVRVSVGPNSWLACQQRGIIFESNVHYNFILG